MTDEDRADLPRTSPALRKALVRMQLEAGRQQLGEEVELLWQPLRHLEDRGRHLGRRLQALGPPLWLALAAPLLVMLVRRRPVSGRAARQGGLTSALRLALLMAPLLRRGYGLLSARRSEERP